MASIKNKIAVVLGAAGLMTSAMTALQPPSQAPHQRARDAEPGHDLADSHEKELERYRDEGVAPRRCGEPAAADAWRVPLRRAACPHPRDPMTWLLSGSPQVADWIKTTEKVPVSFTDALTARGVPTGTRGVVTDISGFFGSLLVVRLDGGLFGSMTLRLRSSQVRVIRRGGGIEAYEESASRRSGSARCCHSPARAAPVLLRDRPRARRDQGRTLSRHCRRRVLRRRGHDRVRADESCQALLYILLVWSVGRLAFGRW